MMLLHAGRSFSTSPAPNPAVLMILLSFCVIETIRKLPARAQATKTSANAGQESSSRILAQNPASRICHGRGTQRS